MKYYECDICGERHSAPYGVNIFKDYGWEVEELQSDGSPVLWSIDKEGNYYTYDVIASVRHYCPLCAQRYLN